MPSRNSRGRSVRLVGAGRDLLDERVDVRVSYPVVLIGPPDLISNE
jgi:hypothetical protein